MPVMSKAGCNAGTCHGNQNGKGGFKLSLRGQDPADDYGALVHDQFGRRTNALDPDQSLALLKPSMQLAHEGGLRLKQGSLEYDILRRWIAAGLVVVGALGLGSDDPGASTLPTGDVRVAGVDAASKGGLPTNSSGRSASYTRS